MFHSRSAVCGAGSSKEAAQKKTEAALQALRGNAEDCNAKLADLNRRMDEAQAEVKALMQKGQKEKAKLALRRKKMIEKQTMAVQNVSTRHVRCACMQLPVLLLFRKPRFSSRASRPVLSHDVPRHWTMSQNSLMGKLCSVQRSVHNSSVLYTRIGSNRGSPQSTIMYCTQIEPLTRMAQQHHHDSLRSTPSV